MCGADVVAADRVRDDSGQDVVEYALLTAFFGLAALAAWTSMRDALGVSYGDHDVRRAGSVGSASAERFVVIEAPSIAVLVLGTAAAATDATTRRIPNALTFGPRRSRVAFAAATGGVHGLGWSVAGWIVGLLLFLPLFALRAMGGGDVKLLAAFGAWLGPVQGVLGGAVWRDRRRCTGPVLVVALWRMTARDDREHVGPVDPLALWE